MSLILRKLLSINGRAHLESVALLEFLLLEGHLIWKGGIRRSVQKLSLHSTLYKIVREVATVELAGDEAGKADRNTMPWSHNCLE